MSTMTITPQAFSPVRTVSAIRTTPAARPAAPARVRLTRRGRALLTLSFLGILLTVMLTVGGSWATATLSGDGTTEPVSVVEVAPGDTLYDIAAGVAAPGQVRETVFRIQELNSLPGAQISVGQRLAVPRG